MKSITLITVLLAGLSAQADGFKCQTTDGSLNIKAFNQTQPELGTRNAAFMVVSDPSVSVGRKTIATFESEETLSSQSSVYTAKVDHRYTASGRKGELILGTKIAHLKTITLDVDFVYGDNLEDGDLVSAMVSLEKRNGDVVEAAALCTRYLKN